MKLWGFKRLTAMLILITSISVAAENTSAKFWGGDGLMTDKVKMLRSKLKDIGYEEIGASENIQDAYFKKYHEKTLDYLSFFTLADVEGSRDLLLAYPRYAAFTPFNLLVYKSQKEDKTWFGKLTAQAIIDMIGDKDPARIEKYKKIHEKLNNLIESTIKPKYTKDIKYTQVAKKPLLEMVKTFDRPKDLDDFLDDFGDAHDEAFEDAKFIIAGFYDLKEAYGDAGKPFDKYDAFWISSVCHFTYSNSVFNHGDPQAGVFAPCTVYFYIEKGSNKLHMGMATVENWIYMSGVTDPVKIESMKKIDKDIVAVFKKLGFVEEGEQAINTKPEVQSTPSVKKETPSKIKHGEKYVIGKVLDKTPAYLVSNGTTVEDLTAKLKANGFEIVATTPVLEGEDVVTVTNDELKNTNGFASVINILVNKNANEVRAQNPDYIGRAFLGKNYKSGMFDKTINALQASMGELYGSTEELKTDKLAGYHFMMGMPYFGDTIELATGEDLSSKAAHSDTVAYTLKLPNGSVLVGHKLGRRTSKFLKKIGMTQDAALLPYTSLIQGNKAVMMDPKYYLALSIPQLSMGEFMKIATIPDAIKKDIAKTYK